MSPSLNCSDALSRMFLFVKKQYVKITQMYDETGEMFMEVGEIIAKYNCKYS